MAQNKKSPAKAAAKPVAAKREAVKPAAKAVEAKPVKKAAAVAAKPVAKAAPAKVVSKPAVQAKSEPVKKPVAPAKPAAAAKQVPAKPVAKPAAAAAPAAAKPVAKAPAKAAPADAAALKPAVAALQAHRAAAAAQQAPRTMPAAVVKPSGTKITAPATPKDLAQKAAQAHQAIAAAAAGPKKPVSSRHGFKTNEWVVYPAHGVGRIVAIEEQEIAGMSLELFVITFEKDKMTLRVPTGKSQAVGMRKLADDGIVKRALETLKGKARIKRTMWSRRAQEFEAKINSGDLVSIAEVVRDLYRAENQPEQSYSERQLYEAALDRMAREIAAVDKMDERGAVQRITEVLSKSAKGRRVADEGMAAAEAEVKAA